MPPYDVILIGGGIMGCCSAFELARRGHRVLVVEKQTVGEGPTGQSSAILRTHYSNELTARMAQYGLEVFSSFPDHVGDECGFHRSGFVMLVEEQHREALQAHLERLRVWGINTELLEGSALEALLPGHDLGAAGKPVVGAWEPDSGYADGYLAVTGYARAAKRLGVSILEDTEVTGIRFASGRVVGVDTNRGSFDAPQVVNTAGAWGARVARLAGLEIPVEACRVQVALFRGPSGVETAPAVVADFVEASYFRPETGGLTLVGRIDPGEAARGVDADHFARKADLAFQADVGARLSRRWPAMATSESTGGYASLYAVTPDWHPIVDEAPSGSGFYLCSGFSGHGFKLAPAVGVMVADLLTAESKPRFDPTLFRLARFTEQREVQGQYEYSIVG